MSTKPKAYLNYLFFDETMRVVAEESGALQVTQANAWKDLTRPIFPINRNGFVYVYSCNDSEAIVRTDNLLVVHYTGRLLEDFHYYPFGLCFDVSKSPALEKSSEQRYNSQFIQQDEFVDGNGQTYGLEDYDFAFRNYDPQIGRWMQPDPLMQHASPYLAMGNNPVLFTDPSGLWDKPGDGPKFVVIGSKMTDDPGILCATALVRPNPDGQQNWEDIVAKFMERDGNFYGGGSSGGGGKSYDIFGNLRNAGDAYGRGNYWANELASREIQRNNGFNSKLINLIGGFNWSDIGMGLSAGGIYTELLKKSAEDALTYKYHYAERKTLEVLARNKSSDKVLNLISKNLGRGGALLGYAGLVSTTMDGIYGKNGWQNHHNADLALQSVLLGASYFAVPGVGWVAGAYFLADFGWQTYSGESITQSIFDH